MAGTGWLIAIIALASVLLLAALGWLILWARRVVQKSEFASARKSFRGQREYLEAKFFQLAAGSGKPRGLEWVNCEFDDDVSYARDRQTGDLAALVGVTIQFAAIEGGGMEGVEAVGNLRAATAVFQYSSGKWRTDGRAIFNLNPTQAIHHFHSSLVMVAQDVATRV